MVTGSVSAIVLQPRHRMADDSPKVDLATLVPRQFGAWEIDPNIRPVQVSPDIEATLKRTYDQIVERTYVDDKQHRVMVSLVYGTDELTEALAAHRPEACYFAQGFQVLLSSFSTLSAGGKLLPIQQLVAVQGSRQEPITYWMTVGEDVVRPGINRRLTQARYGLAGRIPDGVLMRVSSIGADWDNQFALQQQFLMELIAAIPPNGRRPLIGAPA